MLSTLRAICTLCCSDTSSQNCAVADSMPRNPSPKECAGTDALEVCCQTGGLTVNLFRANVLGRGTTGRACVTQYSCIASPAAC